MNFIFHPRPLAFVFLDEFISYMSAGLDPSWYVQQVVVWDPQTDHMFFFLLNDWLSVENHKNSTVEKEVLASCKFLHSSRDGFYEHLNFIGTTVLQ